MYIAYRVTFFISNVDGECLWFDSERRSIHEPVQGDSLHFPMIHKYPLKLIRGGFCSVIN